MIPVFCRETYRPSLDALAARDGRIRLILADLGYPPFWSRPKGFPGLARIILEQQVSLASAARTWLRLEQHLGQVTPKKVAQMANQEFCRLGITRQKTDYIQGLARIFLNPSGPDLDQLDLLPDSQARTVLISVKGIGPWTADIYLIMGLHRMDIFPFKDLALNKALPALGFTPPNPSPEQIQTGLQKFSPFRSLLACLLWHWYIVENRISLPF